MDMIEKLKQALREEMKAQVPVQTLWAVCKSTSMSDGTMVATADGLDYDDVLLGLGGDLVEPMPNTRVLLGLVANKRVACFLLYAEKTKQRYINGNSFGGLVKADVVASELVKAQQDINLLKQLMLSWVPVPSDGGASLKTLTASWAAQPIVLSTTVPLQNPKVKHG